MPSSGKRKKEERMMGEQILKKDVVITYHKLRDDGAKLRLLLPGYRTEGSVVLFITQEQEEGEEKESPKRRRMFECVMYKELQELEYTEHNWKERYRKLYGDCFDDEVTFETMDKENEAAKAFKEDMECYPVSQGSLLTTAADPLRTISVVSWTDETATAPLLLRLKMTQTVPSSSMEIAHIKHTSMLLAFVEIF